MRRGEDAVVELAEVSGLAGCPAALAPLTATSRGTGELIAHALDAGCHPACSSGSAAARAPTAGSGCSQALGARVRDAGGREVGPGGAAPRRRATARPRRAASRTGRRALVVACDVDNPLTGQHGAAAVYGPQKGADPDQVAQLDAALTHWADVVAAATGRGPPREPGRGRGRRGRLRARWPSSAPRCARAPS